MLEILGDSFKVFCGVGSIVLLTLLISFVIVEPPKGVLRKVIVITLTVILFASFTSVVMI